MVDYTLNVTSSDFKNVLQAQTLVSKIHPEIQYEEDDVILFKDCEDDSKLVGNKRIVGVASVEENKEKDEVEIGIFSIMVHGSGTKQALEKSRDRLTVGDMGYVLTVARDFAEEEEYDSLDVVLKEFRSMELSEFTGRLRELRNKTEEAFLYVLLDNLLDLIEKGGYKG
ncbi:hypothetical protein P9X10_01520 [Bacillus cereus]|nr:hypothetical protein [Bacillus cereus]